ncbi:hypothetical protein WJX84_004445 [Apatococcus fuscideae]|uniref:Uncharacterized protein n=1 Tax=Apatococcus fuscideae TaxID=2026836 RepID=A0AAW1T5J0_9CHLO
MDERPSLCDVHFHLQDPRFQDASAIVAGAIRSGIVRLGVVGTQESDWQEVLDFSTRFPEVVPNIGLHPWYVANRSTDWLHRLEDMLTSDPHAGLGECGLDKTRKGSEVPMEEQAEVMTQQLQLGKHLERPITVHCVKAFQELMGVLQGQAPYPKGLILHSWMGPADLVPKLAAIEGVHFSISGHTSRIAARKTGPMLNRIPLDRLLLETDSPDALPHVDGNSVTPLHPVPGDDSGRLNHPANVRVVLEWVAKAMGKPVAEVATATLRNSNRLFPCR